MKTTLFFLMFTSFASAFNIEALREKFMQPGFAGNLDNQFQNTVGNNSIWSNVTELQLQNNSQSMHGQSPKNSLFLISNLAFGEINGRKLMNRGRTHLRYTHMISERAGFEFFGQHQFNFFQQLKARYLAGSNYRYITAIGTKFNMSLGLGLMLDLEEFNTSPQNTEFETPRFNSYLNLSWNISQLLNFISTTYYQPALKELSDHRWMIDNDLIVKLNNTFDLLIGIDILYDRTPIAGVKTTDIYYSQKLRWNF